MDGWQAALTAPRRARMHGRALRRSIECSEVITRTSSPYSQPAFNSRQSRRNVAMRPRRLIAPECLHAVTQGVERWSALGLVRLPRRERFERVVLVLDLRAIGDRRPSGPTVAMSFLSCGRSAVAPLIFSRNTRARRPIFALRETRGAG
jgi:hypothetical protein